MSLKQSPFKNLIPWRQGLTNPGLSISTLCGLFLCSSILKCLSHYKWLKNQKNNILLLLKIIINSSFIVPTQICIWTEPHHLFMYYYLWLFSCCSDRAERLKRLYDLQRLAYLLSGLLQQQQKICWPLL